MGPIFLGGCGHSDKFPGAYPSLFHVSKTKQGIHRREKEIR